MRKTKAADPSLEKLILSKRTPGRPWRLRALKGLEGLVAGLIPRRRSHRRKVQTLAT